MARKLRIAVLSFVALAALVMIPAAAVLKGITSIRSKPLPECSGRPSIEARYRPLSDFPPYFINVLRAAEPDYENHLTRMLIGDGYGHQRPGEFWQKYLVVMPYVMAAGEPTRLAYYLNRVYFGEGCFGADAAARAFFKKDLSELTIEESAKLIATLKAPSSFSILNEPQANIERAQAILEQMKVDAAQ